MRLKCSDISVSNTYFMHDSLVAVMCMYMTCRIESNEKVCTSSGQNVTSQRFVYYRQTFSHPPKKIINNPWQNFSLMTIQGLSNQEMINDRISRETREARLCNTLKLCRIASLHLVYIDRLMVDCWYTQDKLS